MLKETIATLIKEVRARIEENEECRDEADYEGNQSLASYCEGAQQSLQWILNHLEEINEEIT